MHHRLEAALHLYLINRGVLIAPFHNMTLVSPATSEGRLTVWLRNWEMPWGIVGQLSGPQ